MDHYAVFIDLDGTLLDSALTISPETLDAVRSFPSEAELIICTGRAAPSALDITSQLPRDAQPVIVCNGGAILDGDGSVMYAAEGFTRGDLEALTGFGTRVPDVGVCYFTPTRWCTTREQADVTAVMRRTEREQSYVEHFTEIPDQVVKMLFVSHERTALRKVEHALGSWPGHDRFDVMYSYPHCLEVMPAEVSKGEAVGWLLEHYGIGRAHSFAIGDGLNDVSMFDAVGTAFAPTNAHESAISSADHVVANHNEHGVAEALGMIMELARRAEEFSGPSGPLRHVVFFRFQETASHSEIDESIRRFSALSELIEEVKGFEWGLDCGVEDQSRGYTHGFLLTFDDTEGRDRYLVDPAHAAFGDFVRPLLADVVGLDFHGVSDAPTSLDSAGSKG